MCGRAPPHSIQNKLPSKLLVWWHRGQNSFHGSIPSRTPSPKLNSGPTFEVSSSTWNMYNLNQAQPGQMAGDATPKLPATSAPSHRLSLSRDRGVLAISPVPTSLSLQWRNLASCLGLRRSCGCAEVDHVWCERRPPVLSTDASICRRGVSYCVWRLASREYWRCLP